MRWLKRNKRMKPFVIHIGFIISANDGERHIIVGSELIRLWKLPPGLCFVDHDTDLTDVIMDTYWKASGGYSQVPIYIIKGQLHLFPDASGQYQLPLDKELFKQKQIAGY